MITIAEKKIRLTLSTSNVIWLQLRVKVLIYVTWWYTLRKTYQHTIAMNELNKLIQKHCFASSQQGNHPTLY